MSKKGTGQQATLFMSQIVSDSFSPFRGSARNLAGVKVVETQLTVEVTVGGESDGRDVRGEVVSHRVEVTESWHLWATNIVARYWRKRSTKISGNMRSRGQSHQLHLRLNSQVASS